MSAPIECPVLLIGEGATDIGDDEQVPEEDRRPGVLQCLLDQLGGGRIRFRYHPKRWARIGRWEEFPSTTRGDAEHITKTAEAALLRAQSRGCALVFSHDCDNKLPRSKLVQAIEQGFSQAVDRAGNTEREAESLRRVPRVIACPDRMMEAWLLAQESALDRAFGRRTDRRFPFPAPSEVERLYGKKDDAGGNYPKQVLRRALAAYGRKETGKEHILHDYVMDIAREIDLDAVAKEVRSLWDFKEQAVGRIAACVDRRSPGSAGTRQRTR